MQQFEIGTNEAGQRLDKFIHKYLKEAGSGFVYKMLRKKNITLNRHKADGREKLQKGDVVQFFFAEETFLKLRGQGAAGASVIKAFGKHLEVEMYQKAFQNLKQIEVIYEDENVILLNKPAGILSQKATAGDVSLNEWLIGYLLHQGSITKQQLETFKPSICNRLDRNTSGLVICGKSLAGTQKMNELIKTRQLRKFYRTFVKGRIEEPQQLRGYLKKEEKTNTVTFREELSSEDSGFAAIETAYTPIACLTDYTYLEVELLTGKTHQIRAHLSAQGHPLLGDEKYGDMKWNRSFRQQPLPGYQLLHAYRLEFPKLEKPLEALSEAIFLAPEPEVYAKLRERR